MLCLEIRGIKIDFRLPEDRALSGDHVVAINRRRCGEASERVERFLIGCFTTKTTRRSDSGKRNFVHKFSRGVVNLDLRVRVLEVVKNKFLVDERCALECFFSFRNDHLPIAARRISRVDLDELSARRFQVSLKPEACAFIADERVSRIEIVEQLHDGGILGFEILEIDTRLNFRALEDRDNEIIAILANVAAKEPILLIGTFVNEHIIRLRRAEFVKVNFLKVISAFQRVPLRFVVTAIEKSLAVARPGNTGKLHPLEIVGKILHRFDVANFPFLPIGT